MKIVAGQLIAVTQGEYSDYCLMGHFKALQDFDTDEQKAKFKSETKPTHGSNEWASYDSSAFLAWCAVEKLIEELPDEQVVEWYVGSYGDLS